MNNITNKPIFFEKNRVGRVYTGGKLFADFFGDDSVDSYKPEEWVASIVQSEKGNTSGNVEGLSRVREADVSLADLLETHKQEMLGGRDKFDVLTKVLDSAIRLPVQAHPSKAFSREHFNSEYGKTEMWLVLGTREEAVVYFGFKEGVTREEFEKAVDASETDRNAMPNLLNSIPVKVGDVFLIPAGVVHAIGAGCLIFEVQEPTDFTIEPEHWCGEYHLSEKEMFLGLPRELAFDCFNFSISDEELEKISRPTRSIVEETGSYTVETIITYDNTICFAANKLTLKKYVDDKKLYLKGAPSVFLVTEGEGEIIGENYKKLIRKGDYFFLPYCADNKFYLSTKSAITLVEVFASKED